MMKKVLVNRHGNRKFDEEYYAPRYQKYDNKELLKTYRSLKAWIKFIDKYLPYANDQGKKVLEVGCGLGGFAKILSERGFEVIASDKSTFIIEKAKKLNQNIKFSVFDVELSNQLGNKYDMIFAFEVMEHLQNPKKAMKNLKKMLRPGGLLIFTTPYLTKRTISDPTHISVNEPQYWVKLGKKLGFMNLKHKYATFIPFFYRYSSFFSIALPVKTDLPVIGYTCFFSFRK